MNPTDHLFMNHHKRLDQWLPWKRHSIMHNLMGNPTDNVFQQCYVYNDRIAKDTPCLQIVLTRFLWIFT